MLSDEVSQHELRTSAPWKRLKNNSVDSSSLTNLSQSIFDSQDVYTQNSQSPNRKFYQRYMQKRTFQAVPNPTQDSGKGSSASINQERDTVSAVVQTILSTINDTASKNFEQFNELRADFKKLQENVSELDKNQKHNHGDTKSALKANDNSKAIRLLEQILTHVTVKDTKWTRLNSKMNEDSKKIETVLKQTRQLKQDINILKTELLGNLRKEVTLQLEKFQERFLKQQETALKSVTECSETTTVETTKSLGNTKKCQRVGKSAGGRNSSLQEKPIPKTKHLCPKIPCKLGWENKWMSPAYSMQTLTLPQSGILQGKSAKRPPTSRKSKEPNFAVITEEMGCEEEPNTKKKRLR